VLVVRATLPDSLIGDPNLTGTMSAIRVPRQERMFQIFRHNQSRKSNPLDHISAKDAQNLIDEGSAKRLSKWQIVLVKPTPLKLRGPSANIRESTILAALMGSQYHRSLIEAWS